MLRRSDSIIRQPRRAKHVVFHVSLSGPDQWGPWHWMAYCFFPAKIKIKSASAYGLGGSYMAA